MKQISLNKSISIEFKKNKLLISISLLFIVTALNYFYLSYEDFPKGQEWQRIFSSIPFLNTMLISIMMSVLASRCIDIENKGNMWNTLPTLESRKKLFSSKLLFGLIHIALFCFIQTIMILYLGIKFMIGGGFPIFALLQTEFAEIIFGMIIFQLQCLLSLKFRNQFAALSIAFGGTLAGVFIAFVSKSALTPWSVLFSLSTVTMDYDSATREMLLSWNAIDIKAILISLLYFFVTHKVSLLVFNNPETGNFKIALVNRKSKSAHTLLPVELIKIKRNPVWIPFVLIPLISAGIGIINFLSNQGVLSLDWADLWTQESLFLGMFFLSPLIAILASLDFRMEHLGTNWNIMLTSSSRFKV
ncbi:MAG: permease, partial [Lachnospiraceae bacterium]